MEVSVLFYLVLCLTSVLALTGVLTWGARSTTSVPTYYFHSMYRLPIAPANMAYYTV